MNSATYLNNQFLIAMPELADPNFAQTVTLICEHNDEGALGIVINRPGDMTLGEVLAQLDLSPQDPSLRAASVFQGGPVHPERGFVLHDGPGWESSLQVSDELHVTTSRDILHAVAGGNGPGRFLMALGYAGWAAGQLEQEMADNAWLSVGAEPRIVFETPWQDRYREAAELLGIKLDRLGPGAGHA